MPLKLLGLGHRLLGSRQGQGHGDRPLQPKNKGARISHELQQKPRTQQAKGNRHDQLVGPGRHVDVVKTVPAAQRPRAIEGASLHSPFDPIVWHRPRAERLFDFHYRIEIYVPAAKRRWGYYVLPFRIGDRIVARVDLKADRQSGRLLVLAAHEEPGVPVPDCAAALAVELRALSEWLSLETIRVSRRGDFSRALAAALKTPTGN